MADPYAVRAAKAARWRRCRPATSDPNMMHDMMSGGISMAVAMLLATTLGVGVALAQSDRAPSSQAPMTQRGADKSGMMDMSRMNRMMEGMQQHQPSDPGTTTPYKG
jgi:hypothetical protein